MIDKGLQKGILQRIDTKNPNFNNFQGINALFVEYLKKLRVPFFDECCPANSVITPIGYREGDVVVYNTTTNQWDILAISGGGGNNFANADLIATGNRIHSFEEYAVQLQNFGQVNFISAINSFKNNSTNFSVGTTTIYAAAQSNSGNSGISGNRLSDSIITDNSLDNVGYIEINTLNDGQIVANSLNNARIISNKLSGTSFINSNTLSLNGKIENNTLNNAGGISGNSISNNGHISTNVINNSGGIGNHPEINNSSIILNILTNSSFISNNRLTNSSSITLNTFNNNANIGGHTLSSKILKKLTVTNTLFTSNLSGATIVFLDTEKTIFTRLDGTQRLMYYNTSDTPIIVNVNA